uniref:Uncharacterized protein n=1 Tax=Arundo donax TaxID=35708 RepID=A0A0A8ZVF1_ARUDO
MHDMAQLVSKYECFILQNRTDLQKVPDNVRHLSVLSSVRIDDPILLGLLRYRKLRTLLCHESLREEVMKRWCSELRCLHVFSCVTAHGLPEEISKMKNLRYLEIFRPFEISRPCSLKSLPSGLCCLYSLQFLYAANCDFEGLPRELSNLINLQRFESGMVTYHRSDSKTMIINGYAGESLDQLFHSRSLSSLTSDGFGSSSSGLECTSYFENSLSMNQNVTPMVPAHNNNDSIGNIFLSLEGLVIQHCHNLSSLEQCLQPAYVPAIKKISIQNCKRLLSLPIARFGPMHCLVELNVSNCPNIRSGALLVPSLERLELLKTGNLGDNIESCSVTYLELSNSSLTSIQLKKWNLPALQKLRITDCPSLTSVVGSEPVFIKLFHHGGTSSIRPFSSLTELLIYNCSKLQALDDLLTYEYLPAIASIRVKNCEDLLTLPAERFRSFPSLNELIIHHCPRLNWQKGMVLPGPLQRLSLHNCGDFSAWFPSCLENLTSLENLQLVSCKGIVSVPGHLWNRDLASLKELRIESCPDLVSIGGESAIANIEMVHISNCQNLKEVQQPLSIRIF